MAAALTILFYCMRSVMEIGGSCPSGNTPGDHPGVAFGWLICGVLFAAMGGISLLIAMSTLRSNRATRRAPREVGAQPDVARMSARNARIAAWVLQIVTLGLGIWAGIELFESATGSTVTFG